MKKTIKVDTNKDAVLSAMGYCQAVIKGLEALKLSPEFRIEGIQELKDRIPSIEEYKESTGEKSIERQAPTFIPPSDYDDLRIERLLKKKV